MTSKEQIQILTPTRAPRALVLGDLMLDRMVWGSTERISPEAPVPVVRTHGEEDRLGGAGNVAANLAALGAKVTAVGVVGRDAEGEGVRQMLRGLRVSSAGVRTEAGRATTLKTRVIAQGQHLLRVDREHTVPIGKGVERTLRAYLAKALSKADVMVISDYDKGLLTPGLLRAAIRAAGKAKIPVVVDPKARDFGLYAGATVVKPNLREFHQAAGAVGIVDTGPSPQRQRGPTGETDCVPGSPSLEAGARLLKQHRFDALVVTLGGEGMALFRRGKKMRLFGTARREAYDVTGAGDTACAAIAFVLGCGHGLEEAIEIANVAAGAAVSKVGTAPVGSREIVARLEDMHHSLSQKIKTVEELLPLLHAHRSHREKVAFTNGCFDVLHVGHIGLLKYARRQGDRLVVAVNSDASVRRLKGQGRPILLEEERTQILAALEDVDYIVIFDEKSVLPLIKRLKPDILVKGADYRKSDIVGQAFVESHGGVIRRAPLVEGVSTTNIVEKIRGG